MFAKHWIKLTIMGALGFAIVGLSCSDEVADPVEPDLNKPLVVTHISAEAGSAIVIDGQEDAVWNDAKEFKYVIVDSTSKKPSLLYLKALTDSTYFYLLARWNDPTEDIRPKLWWFKEGTSWDSTGGRQDFFCAIFDDGRNEPVGVNCYKMCHLTEGRADRMVNPGSGLIDAWVWMAGLTNPVGTLEDIHYGADSSFRSDDENNTPGMNAYVRNYDGLENKPEWMPKDVPNHRTDFMFWEDIVPFSESDDPDSIPGYYLNARSTFFGTSKWEVDAKGLYNKTLGQWTVEFRRKLDTGNDDDIPFVLGESINCAVAVTTEGEENRLTQPHIGRSPIEIRF